MGGDADDTNKRRATAALRIMSLFAIAEMQRAEQNKKPLNFCVEGKRREEKRSRGESSSGVGF